MYINIYIFGMEMSQRINFFFFFLNKALFLKILTKKCQKSDVFGKKWFFGGTFWSKLKKKNKRKKKKERNAS